MTCVHVEEPDLVSKPVVANLIWFICAYLVGPFL